MLVLRGLRVLQEGFRYKDQAVIIGHLGAAQAVSTNCRVSFGSIALLTVQAIATLSLEPNSLKCPFRR